VEEQLCKAATASSAARVFPRKQLCVANNSKKSNPWWNALLKQSIPAKNATYMAWGQNNALTLFQSVH